MSVMTSTVTAFLSVITTHAAPQSDRDVTSLLTSKLISSVQSVGGNGRYYVTSTVQLENPSDSEVVLACDLGKVRLSDDLGNQYKNFTVRGIGLIDRTSVDARFAVPPKTKLEFFIEGYARFERGTPRGVKFDLAIPLSEVKRLPGQRLQLGTERTFDFAGLEPAFPARPVTSVDSGPFTTEFLRQRTTRVSKRSKSHEVTLKVTNSSDKPLILGYEHKSSFAIDNVGNRYDYFSDRESDDSAVGIGIVRETRADPKLVLKPNESREIRFSITRRISANEQDGTEYAYYAVIQSLQILPSGQVQTIRPFSIALTGIKG